MIGRRLVNGFQHDAGFHGHGLAVAVDRADAVHPLKRHDNLAAAFVRHLGADQAGIAALGNERLAFGRRQSDDCGDLIGRCRPQHGRAAAVKQIAPFMDVGRLVMLAGQHVGIADNGGKPGKQAVGFHGVLLSCVPSPVEMVGPHRPAVSHSGCLMAPQPRAIT